MKESRLMLIQYYTAIAALVLVTIHLLMQGIIVPYSVAISFERVLEVYRSLIDVAILELLLVSVVIHGFNGLRVILLEWRQGRAWSRSINLLTMIAVLVTIAYGTRTIIIAITGQVT